MAQMTLVAPSSNGSQPSSAPSIAAPTGSTCLLHVVQALLILDNEGRKLFGKYYTDQVVAKSVRSDQQQQQQQQDDGKEEAKREQRAAFERKLWTTLRKRPTGEVALVDRHLVLYKHNLDVTVFLVGSAHALDCNELMLQVTLEGFFEALDTLLKYTIFLLILIIIITLTICRPQVDKRAILDEYDTVVHLADACIDLGGVILDPEAASLVSKLTQSGHGPSSSSLAGGRLPEPSLSGALQFAKDALAKRILK
jgi:hypothetical protein